MNNTEDCVLAMSLRLAVLFCRNRSDSELPALHGVSAAQNSIFRLMPAGWRKIR